LARVCKVDKETCSFILEHYFTLDGKTYRNKRADIEMGNAENRREIASENGKKGGRPKGSIKPDSKTRTKELEWNEMLNYFGNKCLCCGAVFEEGTRPTKDHIKPRSKGGCDEIYNFQPLCRECNTSKFNKHETDYRLAYYSKIPQELRIKWFEKKPDGYSEHPNKGVIKNPQKSSSSSSSSSSLSSSLPEEEEPLSPEKDNSNNFNAEPIKEPIARRFTYNPNEPSITSRIENHRKAWNTAKLPECRYTVITFKDFEMADCTRALQFYTDDEISEAIGNYSKIIGNPDYDIFPYKSFTNFMGKGVERYVTSAKPFDAFKRKARDSPVSKPEKDFTKYNALMRKE